MSYESKDTFILSLSTMTFVDSEVIDIIDLSIPSDGESNSCRFEKYLFK